MSHLTAETIGRYLDGDLSAVERAAANEHLAGCAACRAELAAEEALFAALADWPAERPPLDLAAGVLARLTSPRWGARAWLLLAAQAGLCLALALASAPLLGAAAALAAGLAAALPAAPAPPDLAAWAAGLVDGWRAWKLALGGLAPVPLSALGAGEWAGLLGAAALTWLAANRYLLRGARAASPDSSPR